MGDDKFTLSVLELAEENIGLQKAGRDRMYKDYKSINATKEEKEI